MGYTALTVLNSDVDGDEVLALLVGSDTQGDGGFEFANDGRVLLYVFDQLALGAGDTITFQANADKYGNTPSPLTRTVTLKKAYFYGPFNPEEWNKTGGMVRFKFTTANAKTEVMAIRVKNPS